MSTASPNPGRGAKPSAGADPALDLRMDGWGSGPPDPLEGTAVVAFDFDAPVAGVLICARGRRFIGLARRLRAQRKPGVLEAIRRRLMLDPGAAFVLVLDGD